MKSPQIREDMMNLIKYLSKRLLEINKNLNPETYEKVYKDIIYLLEKL